MNGELDALIDRLSGGEIIDPESLPDSLRSHPQVQALLKLSRVLGQLDANQQATDAPRSHAEPVGPFRLTRRKGRAGEQGERQRATCSGNWGHRHPPA